MQIQLTVVCECQHIVLFDIARGGIKVDRCRLNGEQRMTNTMKCFTNKTTQLVNKKIQFANYIKNINKLNKIPFLSVCRCLFNGRRATI